ncbi:MAG: TerB family tellurite resistance protein [Burkholderiales bacterium]|nr:TerB family tellurite resistance protein [Burkholderiales bacterium]
MLDRLRALLAAPPAPTADTVGAPFPREQLAVVALAIELAQSDRRLGPEELATVERIAAGHFGLDADAAARLAATAKRELDAALEDWIFAHAVREGFAPKERAEIVAMLWEVVYADGRLAPLEEALLNRLAGQLGIADDDCEAARAQAFARRAASAGGASE